MVNVINVSVTDSFHSSYSERGAGTDNYDSDECQEFDLRNSYSALMGSVQPESAESDAVLVIRVTLRPRQAACHLSNNHFIFHSVQRFVMM